MVARPNVVPGVDFSEVGTPSSRQIRELRRVVPQRTCSAQATGRCSRGTLRKRCSSVLVPLPVNADARKVWEARWIN